jgi:RHS repeat-associated protein
VGTSSARPGDLDRFADRSRGADDELRSHDSRLRGAYGSFVAGTQWGVLDCDSMLRGFTEFIHLNDIDERWVQRIATAFRRAGGDGAISSLPDAAIAASLRAAGLDGGRNAITFDGPIAYGFPPTTGYANDPVNTASGNFVELENDLPFTGLARGLRIARVYNSRSDRIGAFGTGWSSWTDARLRPKPDGAEYEGPDGQRALFARMGDGYGRVVGINAIVEPLAEGLVLRWWHGERWEFDDAGLPVRWDHGPGTEVRFRHDGGRLVELAHAGGRRVGVDWDGDRIGTLACSDGRRVSYRYDAAGNLEQVDGAAGVRRYETGDDGRVVSVLDADDVAEVVNTYDEDGRVLEQQSPFGRRTAFGYLPGQVTVTADEQDGPSNIYIHDDAGRVLAIIDGAGQRTAVTYDEWGNPAAVTERGGAVTVQEWDERGHPLRRVLPTGAEFHFAHDATGRVLEVASSTGALVRHVYEGDERSPSEVTDAEGGVTRMTVRGGLVRAIVDPDGVELRFEFDEDGNIVASTDADGNVARVERDAAGLVTAAITPLGRRTTFVHDAQGRPLQRRDPSGAVWRYEYSPAGRLTGLVDPTGARDEIRYASHGEAEAVVDALGRVTTHSYDVFGNRVEVVAPDGATWRYGYDALCRLTRIADPSGATWLREYDVNGNLTDSIDPAGTHYAAMHDEAGRVTALHDGLTSATFDFDPLGRCLTHLRPDDTAARADYDLMGRRTSIEDPLGGTSTIEYTPGGRVRRVVQPSGSADVFEYDRCGRAAGRIDGAGRRWEFRYDADGALVETVTPTGDAERFAYDDGGRLTEWSAPGHGLTSYSYDAARRVTAITDRASGTRRFEYDAAGQLVAATDANGAVTRYAYDERGRVTARTDPLGGTVTRTYDPGGRLASETDQLGRTMTFAYDAAGRLVERVDGAGRRRQWSYDVSGRVRTFGAGGEEPVTIARDGLGREIAVEEPGGFSHAFGWDRAGRLVARRRGELALRWGYDEDGRRAFVGYPDGSETAYAYDAGGRLATLHHAATGPIELERDAGGRLVGARGGGMRARWEYDGGELTGYTFDAGDVRRSARLTRDPIGRVVAAVADGAEQRFAYDPAGQLVEAGDFAFDYDAGGRLARERSPAGTVDYEHDAAGQLVRRLRNGSGETTYAYDGSGRRVRERGDGLERMYRWDALGRLSAIEDGEGATRAAIDALGELAEVDGTPLLWDSADALSPLAWIDDSAVIGHGTAWATASGGEAEWLAPDWQGTIGGPRDPFGAPLGPPDPGLRLGYRGELELDGETWLRARAYDSATRAFLSPDPLPPVPGGACAANPYHYAANNPLGQADPLGLRPVTDQELRDIRDRMGHNVFQRGADFVSDNIDYIAAGALVVGGIAVMATGVGGPLGAAMIGGALLSAGGSAGIQKITTGRVNYREVAVAGIIGAGAGGLGYGAGALVSGGTKAAAFGRGALAGGVESVAGGAANRGIHGQNAFDPAGMRNDLLLGGGIGGVGGRLGWREPPPARAPTDLHAFGPIAGGPRAPRVDDDYLLDDAGHVIPQGGQQWPRGASTFGDPHQAPLKGQYHRIPEGTELPRGLDVKADGIDVGGPQPPTHHSIYPTESMSPEEFTDKFKGLPWEHAGKIK